MTCTLPETRITTCTSSTNCLIEEANAGGLLQELTAHIFVSTNRFILTSPGILSHCRQKYRFSNLLNKVDTGFRGMSLFSGQPVQAVVIVCKKLVAIASSHGACPGVQTVPQGIHPPYNVTDHIYYQDGMITPGDERQMVGTPDDNMGAVG